MLEESNYRDVSEVEAIGLSAKYLRKLPGKYEVTRGKSKVMWRAVLMLVAATVIIAVSARWIPSDMSGNSFFTPLLLLPRLGAIVLVYMAAVRIRQTSRHQPLLVFSSEGILLGEKIITWNRVMSLHLKGGSQEEEGTTSLIITTLDKTKTEIVLHKIDEFPEDVAVMLNRYFKKFGDKKVIV